MEKTVVNVSLSNIVSQDRPVTEIYYHLTLYDKNNYTNIIYKSNQIKLTVTDLPTIKHSIPIITKGLQVEPDLELIFISEKDIILQHQLPIKELTGKPQQIDLELIQFTLKTQFTSETLLEQPQLIQIGKLFFKFNNQFSIFTRFAIELETTYTIRKELFTNFTSTTLESDSLLSIEGTDQLKIRIVATPLDLMHLTQYYTISEINVDTKDLDSLCQYISEANVSSIPINCEYINYMEMITAVLQKATSFGTERIKFNYIVKEQMPQGLTQFYMNKISDVQPELNIEDPQESEHYKYIRKQLKYKANLQENYDFGVVSYKLQVMKTQPFTITSLPDFIDNVLQPSSAHYTRFLCPQLQDLEQDYIICFNEIESMQVIPQQQNEQYVIKPVQKAVYTCSCELTRETYSESFHPYTKILLSNLENNTTFRVLDMNLNEVFVQNFVNHKLLELFTEKEIKLNFQNGKQTLQIPILCLNYENHHQEKLKYIEYKHNQEIEKLNLQPLTYNVDVRDVGVMAHQDCTTYSIYRGTFTNKMIDLEQNIFSVADNIQMQTQLINKCHFDENMLPKDFQTYAKKSQQKEYNHAKNEYFKLHNVDKELKELIKFVQNGQTFPESFRSFQNKNIQVVYVGLKLEVKNLKNFKFDSATKLIGQNGVVLTDLDQLLKKKTHAKPNGELELQNGQTINLNECFDKGQPIVESEMDLRNVELVDKIVRICDREHVLLDLTLKSGIKCVKPYVIRNTSKLYDETGRLVCDLLDVNYQFTFDEELNTDVDGDIIYQQIKLVPISQLQLKSGRLLCENQKSATSQFKVSVEGTLLAPDGSKVGKLDDLVYGPSNLPVSAVKISQFTALTYRIANFQLFKGAQYVCDLKDIKNLEGQAVIEDKWFAIKTYKVSIDGYLVINNERVIKLNEAFIKGESILQGRVITPMNALKYKIENGNIMAPDGVCIGNVNDVCNKDGIKVAE
ncbi:Conserved_hypothetical protein [Hexamita inflata]|uniref:Uncharacterized protein n=1 Tax=Hexamita inflata TaxID=28002 RepID=A0AA86U6B0_9EUKA|nr:Conserved hypothetical protein [Hexamita inflata]